MGCCRGAVSGGVGEWYFPNNMTVGTIGGGGSFYRNRAERVVRLSRRYDAMMPTGSFCCTIPDANNVIQRICVMIKASTVIPDGV